jgi:hypothetical protein
MAVGKSKTLWTLIALAAIGVLFFALVFFAFVLPPAPERLDTNGWAEIAARTVAGAYHIHTTRSDGHGDKHDVAAAAARAGLKFVILTDHGDGTRPPDPPEYIDGVLCLDGVEISTDEGHLVAIDMPRAPYPFGGSADAVVEDVHRLGGFAIAAHPDSPKPALRWTDASAPIDGIEWLNIDSEWRKDTRGRLIRAGLAYFLRPGPALASLMDRPETLQRWDRLSATRRVVGLAGVDAHGGVGRRAEDTGRSLAGTIGIPSYEASFRTFSNRVILDAPLTGDPARDTAAVYSAIRQGRVFSTIDAVAGPGLVDFRLQGEALVAHATRPQGADVSLLHDGEVEASSKADVRYDASAKRGAYRVEVRVPSAPGQPPIPWLVSNNLYVGAPSASSTVGTLSAGTPGTLSTGTPGIRSTATPAPSAPSAPPALSSTAAPFPWRIEKDPASSAILRTTGHSVELEYQLADGPRNSQFVALATDIRNDTITGMRFGLQTDRPARVSVQVRTADGRRWGRSYYVDPAGSELVVPLMDLRPIGTTTGGSPDPKALTSVLLVVDLTNAVPGHSGRLTVLSSELVK